MPKRKTRSSTKAAEHAQDEHSDQERETQKSDQKQGQSQTEDRKQEDIQHYTIPFNDNKKQITCERRSPHKNKHSSPTILIFTHGAGGGITAPATSDFASGFADIASIVCFAGSMNLTNRIKYFHTVLQHEKGGDGLGSIALGGRSMGARAAVLTAWEQYNNDDEAAAASGNDDVVDDDDEKAERSKTEALVLVSYPLLAGGTTREPERREQILFDLPEDVDVLFIVGSADSYCPLEMLEEVRGEMVARSWVCVVEAADHGMGLKPKKDEEGMRRLIGKVAARWLGGREKGRTESRMKLSEEGEIVFGGWEEVVVSESEGKRQKT